MIIQLHAHGLENRDRFSSERAAEDFTRNLDEINKNYTTVSELAFEVFVDYCYRILKKRVRLCVFNKVSTSVRFIHSLL